METKEYLNLLLSKYNKHFTIEKNIYLYGKELDLFAKYNGEGGRTFLTQKNIIDKYEFNEYCLVKVFEHISLDNIIEYTEYLKETTNKLVNPNRDHKCTTITGVIIVSQNVDESCKRFIKNFKYSKPYLFYFHGWSDIYLLLIDLSDDIVIANKAANKVKKVYNPTPLNKK